MHRRRLVPLSLLALSACSVGLTAGTARTLPPGSVQHAVGVVPRVYVSELCNEDGSGCSTDVYAVPPPPTWQLRYGLTERLELGGTVTLTEVTARLRWNLLRGETLALSLQPGLLCSSRSGPGCTRWTMMAAQARRSSPASRARCCSTFGSARS